MSGWVVPNSVWSDFILTGKCGNNISPQKTVPARAQTLKMHVMFTKTAQNERSTFYYQPLNLVYTNKYGLDDVAR